MREPPESESDCRIAICGSAGVGRTTLAQALAYELKLPYIAEEMRSFLVTSRRSLSSFAPHEIEVKLLRLQRERREAERSARDFVADTGALDFIAHALFHGCSSTALLAEIHPLRYRAIFVLPWGVLPYRLDGVRPPDQASQLGYQRILESLLRRHTPTSQLHFLPDNIRRLHDRLRWAAACLAAVPATLSRMQGEFTR